MKPICVRQHDQSDCGAAALASIAKYYHRPIPVQQLRDFAGTDRIGTNMLGLVQAAQQLGFETKGVKGTYEALLQVPLPAIAHIKTDEGNGHFVVLYKLGKKLTIADPGVGIVKWSPAEFQKRWTGYLLLLSPSSKRPELEAPKSPRERLFRLLSNHKGTLLEAFLCALFVTVLGLLSSFYIQQLVDSILLHQEAKLLDLVGVGMLLVLGFKVVFGGLRQYLLAHMSRKIDLGLVRDYFRHILRLPIQFFETRQVGEILSRVNDASRIRQLISGVTVSVILDAVFALSALAVMFLYSWKLAIVAVLFVPLFLGSIYAHLPILKRRRRKMMEEAAVLEGRLVEDVAGVEAVKALAIEEDRVAGTEKTLVRFLRQIFSGEMISLSLGTTGMLLNGLASLVILWYGGSLVMEGTLTVGQLMFFSTILHFMIGPMERLAGLNMQIQDAMIALDRLGEILDLPVEGAGAKKAALPALREGIRLEKVAFRYGCREEVLREIDLEIPAGKTVAIIGESGSGKSTLCKLLSGFYPPTSGRILFDGMDVRDLDLESIRKRTGWVQQEPFILSGTIRENIAVARPEATFQEMVEAARVAQLADFIETLPERYETKIGERGVNLSGGQKQRLAIARAVLRQPDLFIFDEATSHLDTKTERAIQVSLRQALAGRTAVLIAHRLSTIRWADLIVVLEGGRVVEQGTHETLLAKEGKYAELWDQQQGNVPLLAIDESEAA